jgi:hypothetical protein
MVIEQHFNLVVLILKHPSLHGKVKLDVMFLAIAHNMIVAIGYLVGDPRQPRLFLIGKKTHSGTQGLVKNGVPCPQGRSKFSMNIIVRMQVDHE